MVTSKKAGKGMTKSGFDGGSYTITAQSLMDIPLNNAAAAAGILAWSSCVDVASNIRSIMIVVLDLPNTMTYRKFFDDERAFSQVEYFLLNSTNSSTIGLLVDQFSKNAELICHEGDIKAARGALAPGVDLDDIRRSTSGRIMHSFLLQRRAAIRLAKNTSDKNSEGSPALTQLGQVLFVRHLRIENVQIKTNEQVALLARVVVVVEKLTLQQRDQLRRSSGAPGDAWIDTIYSLVVVESPVDFAKILMSFCKEENLVKMLEIHEAEIERKSNEKKQRQESRELENDSGEPYDSEDSALSVGDERKQKSTFLFFYFFYARLKVSKFTFFFSLPSSRFRGL